MRELVPEEVTFIGDPRPRKLVDTSEKWDMRFLDIASVIATWSKEPNTRVGCVIVDDKRRIVATGYNGFPRGVKDAIERIEDRDVKLAMTLHAEDNALLYAGRTVEGCTAYITHPPCSLCAAKLIQSGIKRVVFAKLVDESFLKRWGSSLELGRKMAAEARMSLEEAEYLAPRIEYIPLVSK